MSAKAKVTTVGAAAAALLLSFAIGRSSADTQPPQVIEKHVVKEVTETERVEVPVYKDFPKSCQDFVKYADQFSKNAGSTDRQLAQLITELEGMKVAQAGLRDINEQLRRLLDARMALKDSIYQGEDSLSAMRTAEIECNKEISTDG
jgi:predicted outer membrane protein